VHLEKKEEQLGKAPKELPREWVAVLAVPLEEGNCAVLPKLGTVFTVPILCCGLKIHGTKQGEIQATSQRSCG
jgi:hypothetical protein